MSKWRHSWDSGACIWTSMDEICMLISILRQNRDGVFKEPARSFDDVDREVL
jgi:hypothetical protein